MPMCVRGSK